MKPTYPEHEKAESLQTEFMMLRGFLDFLLDHHDMTVNQEHPQSGNIGVPVPERRNNVSMDRNVCAFLGIDYDAYMVEAGEIERIASAPASKFCSV